MNWLPSIGNLFSSYSDASYGMKLLSGTGFGSYKRQQIVDMALQNPAFLKVLSLQCDTFSMGKIYAYRNGKEVKSEAILDLVKNPNGSTQAQFLWDYMFWLMLGDVFLWIPNKEFEGMTKFIFLDIRHINFPSEIRYKKILLSTKANKELEKMKLDYSINGQSVKIPWSEVLHITDLSNTMSGEIMGLSRLDALYKIIINSEEALKSKKINTEFSRKFLVAGSVDAMDVTKRMLTNDEKDDIEKKVLGDKSVHAVKSMIEIKRFMENMKNLELSKSYLEDYFLIGNMYNIPRDVLEAFNSSTYENQEKARAMHVAYTCEPKGEALGQALAKYFGSRNDILVSYDHLPFVQVLEKGREETKKLKLENLKFALDLGVSQEEALKFVDLDFKEFTYEKPSAEIAGTAGNGGEESGQDIDPVTETED